VLVSVAPVPWLSELKYLVTPLLLSNKALALVPSLLLSHTKSGLKPNPVILCVLPLPV